MLISEQGFIKLGDLGLAVQLASPEATIRGQSGTVQYLAPEVFEEKTGVKSDIWALGVSIIEIATGKHPYMGLTECQVCSLARIHP